jgi:hypothetical protein
MRDLISAEYLRRLRETPNFKRRLKVIVGVGVLGILVAGGLAVYGGFLGVRYVMSQVPSVDVARHAEAIKSQVEGMPAVAKVECLAAAQGLLSIERLLSAPLMDNIQTLKRACFEGTIEEPETGKEGELI